MSNQPTPASGISRGRGRASSRDPGTGRGHRPVQLGQTETIKTSTSGGSALPTNLPCPPSRGLFTNVQLAAAAVPRPPVPADVLGRAQSDFPVTEREGAAGDEKKLRGNVRGTRTIADIVHSRPANLATKAGKTGKRVTLQTNYFRVLQKPEWTIYQYRVDFSPDIDNVRLRRAFLNDHKEKLGGYIFDGTVLFCIKKFFTQANKSEIELITKSRAGETIQIKIRYVSLVESTDSQQFQVLNLILRRSMEGLKLQLISRNFFDPVAKINLENYRIEIWPGYQTSIRQHEQDVLLCAEIAHKVMRTENLYHILLDCTKESKDVAGVYKKEVTGMIVLTDYNNKTYRVDDVDFNSTPMSKFSTKDGDITYVEYYKKRYNITIRDNKQPLLVSRPTEKNIRGGMDQLIMLIPELARATGMTDAMRSNFKLMKAMSEHTRLTPDRRIDRLRNFNHRLQSSAQSVEVLTSWDLKLDQNLVEVPGRILPAENILFGNGKLYACDARADWTNEFRKNAMFSHVDIKRWYLIVPRRLSRESTEFVKLCVRAAKGMQMHISEPRIDEIPDDRVSSFSQAIDNAASKDPQIIMVVLQSSNEEKYSCIKKRACVDRPVPSQVVTAKTIAPRAERSAGLMSIATKVVIQMNAKLTGAPWTVEIPLRGLMAVGFDVCHSSKNKNKSYGALVASMDMRSPGRYFSSVTEHMKGQELSNEMAMNMTYALKSYRETHGTLPERIIFFRDGVGDGQLFQVVNTEVQLLKKKLDEMYKSSGRKDGCRMAFIIVTKRINTRYFTNKRNPSPGTVVDDIITLPERYDFFLVSQSVRQGTVSPTNYNVIHDSMGLDADKLQMLAFKMTHMYYNYSGTCRVPAVCQYAHKLAFLVAEHINRAPAAGLENQLYFL